MLQELRELAPLYDVFRGQVLSFDREMFGPGSGLLRFLEVPFIVVVAAHLYVAMDLDLLRSAMGGHLTISIKLDPFHGPGLRLPVRCRCINLTPHRAGIQLCRQSPGSRPGLTNREPSLF